MMNYVLDSSFCGAFIMPDEETPRVNAFFKIIPEDSVIYVPALFWFEISNLLTTAIRRERIQPSDTNDLLELLSQVKFDTDYSFGSDYSRSITTFAVKYHLTAYDASYLELAGRKSAVVGTLDGNLLKACIKAGLDIVQ